MPTAQPSAPETFDQILRARAAAEPNRTHIFLRDEHGREQPITFGRLLASATELAKGLAGDGLEPGHNVALMLPTSAEFFSAFLGVILAGGVPVPIYPPARADQITEYAERQGAILRDAEARVLLTFREARNVARLLGPSAPALRRVATVEQVAGMNGGVPELSLKPPDPALIQYTSGSTGRPKGVVLTHANLVANVKAIAHGVGKQESDVVVSWLPLYHDMGLIGCWLFSLHAGLTLVSTSPLHFLRRPERWLRMIHDHRGSLSPAPNFAFELCLRKVPDRAMAGLDLSSWRVALNGAEPVHPDTLARFTERFGPCGFRAETMLPVYGLAECTVALSFPPLGRPPLIDSVQRDSFLRERRAVPAGPGDTTALRFVCVGRALPGNELRVVDDKGRVVRERLEGRVQFRGQSAMAGYYRNPEATAEILHDGWYDSGDLGYLAGGELYITGRSKDLIIRAGHNIYPQELEAAAGEVTGIRKGCVVAFAVADIERGTEQIVVVAETRERSGVKLARLRHEVVQRLARDGHPPDEVVLVKPQTVPKTPSGKLRRSTCRQMYLDGTLSRRRPPAWWQIALLVSRAVINKLREPKPASRTDRGT